MNCGNITIEDINCVGEMISSEIQVATDNDEEEDSHPSQQQLISTTDNNGSKSLPPQTQQQTTTIINNLATEHGIFLRAILDLLNQRDQIALESDINSQNTIKVGTLRKASHRMKGKWKTKYVELRRGTFSYYTDTSTSSNKKQSDLKRNDIQLHASKCTCQAVTIHSVKILSSSKTNGTVFEIKVQNGKRRLWMTNTIEECKSWIQAIHNAMIGASVVRGDNFLEYSTREQQSKKKKGRHNNIHVPTNSPYKAYLEQYLQIRQATQIATTKDEYISALQTLEDQPMKVPVQWIRLQLSDNNNNTLSNTAFHELDVSTSVEQLWKDLLRDSVKFNNEEVLVGDAFHGPERIVGRLTQLILSSCDAVMQDNSNDYMEQSSSNNQSVISEAQAIRYARDILLASNRTRSGGDSYYCAENLCLNRNMIVICPSSSEATPLSITVSKKGSTIGGGDSHVLEDVSGWVYARSSSSKSWKRQYIMLSSHGVLTCYAEALPKPHEMVEQITLHEATIVDNNNSNLVEKQKVKQKKSSSKNESTFISGHVVHIKTKDGKTSREYLFEDEFDYLYWHDSLQQAANSLNKEEEANGISTSSVISNGYHCNRLHSTPAVEVVVNVCTEYKIASMDPVGIESEDTWAKLRTTFVQKFSLTGGGSSRGDEVVQLELM